MQVGGQGLTPQLEFLGNAVKILDQKCTALSEALQPMPHVLAQARAMEEFVVKEIGDLNANLEHHVAQGAMGYERQLKELKRELQDTQQLVLEVQQGVHPWGRQPDDESQPPNTAAIVALGQGVQQVMKRVEQEAKALGALRGETHQLHERQEEVHADLTALRAEVKTWGKKVAQGATGIPAADLDELWDYVNEISVDKDYLHKRQGEQAA